MKIKFKTEKKENIVIEKINDKTIAISGDLEYSMVKYKFKSGDTIYSKQEIISFETIKGYNVSVGDKLNLLGFNKIVESIKYKNNMYLITIR